MSRQIPLISLLCVLILCTGFYLGWIGFWDDENWLSRSGGTVVFISGSWLVITLNASRNRLEAVNRDELRYLEKLREKVINETPSQILPEELSVLKEDKDLEKLWRLHPDILVSLLGAQQKLAEAHWDGQYAALRFIEYFWLGIGTLFWAWGDIIQFIDR